MQSKLSDNLRQIHAGNETERLYVHNWKETLPAGSDWTPGSHGDPACQICLGRGWVRLDVPTHHPKFGKLQLCDCVSADVRLKLDYENGPDYKPVSKSGGGRNG